MHRGVAHRGLQLPKMVSAREAHEPPAARRLNFGALVRQAQNRGGAASEAYSRRLRRGVATRCLVLPALAVHRPSRSASFRPDRLSVVTRRRGGCLDVREGTDFAEVQG